MLFLMNERLKFIFANFFTKIIIFVAIILIKKTINTMKIFLLFFSLFILSLTVKSQDIIVYFSLTGADNQIDSVTINNTTTGVSISTTKDHINLTNPTAIEQQFSNSQEINIFPNPFTKNSKVEFYSSVNQNINVCISDDCGRTCVRNYSINQGLQTFNISTKDAGLYIISISGDNFKLSKKVISLSSNNATNIELISSNNHKKSQTDNFYTVGDVLVFTVHSGNYSTSVTSSPTTSENITFYDCIDYDGNHYPTLVLGSQIWMAENLKSTHYLNGTTINGAYVYQNNSANEDIYGKLYTWAAVMHGANGTNDFPSTVQGICPNGWHVPSEAEWDTLRDYLGGWQQMHAAIKETGTEHWNASNADATNSSGMTVRPGGCRWGDDGSYQYLGDQAFFWTATDDLSGLDVDHASGYTFWKNVPDNSSYMYTWNLKAMAQSVRCVKN